jgi:hypothetical protein
MKTSSYIKIDTIRIKRKKKLFLWVIPRNPKYQLSSLKLKLAEESKYFENIESNLAVGLNENIENEIKNKEITDLVVTANAYLAEPNLKVREAYWHKDIVEEELYFKLQFNPSNEPLELEIKKTVVFKKQEAYAKISIKKYQKYQGITEYNDIKNELGIVQIENIGGGYRFPLQIKNLHFKLKDTKTNEEYENLELLRDYSKQVNINPGGKQNFILNIDLEKLPHPTDEKEYMIIISGEKKTDNNEFKPINPNTDFEPCTIKIAPNKKKTDLFVNVDEEDKTECDSIDLDEVVYDLKSVMDTKIISEIQIGNRSDVFDASNTDYLEIRNLQLSKVITPVNEKQNNEKYKQQISNLIKIEYQSPNVTEWTSVLKKEIAPTVLKNGKNAVFTLKVKIDFKDFQQLDPKLQNKNKIDIVLNFNYTIKDKDGRIKRGEKQKKYKISFFIRQFEGDQWLALDFGTSAIVAQYGNRKSNNLESKVKSHFKYLVEKDIAYHSEDYDEIDEALLSATIALRKDKTFTGEFKDSIVSISPKKEALYSNDQYILPYLKSLVGHEQFPKDYLKLIKEEGLKTIRPLEIIEETYKTLLNSLVIPAFEGIRKNKIILTIPNSFTTLHKNILRKIIKEILKDIWEDYIIFLSESDAVAWYYIDHSFELLQYADKSELASLREETPLEDEIVLVYDMGAGTLDLTLFRIKTNKQKKEVTILGKIGQISGGNYADYVIGKEFWKQVKNTDGENYNPMKMGICTEFPNEKIKYRMFIRNELKPAMNTLNQSDIKTRNFYAEYCTLPSVIDFEALIKSKSYKDYLVKNTTTILSLLKSTSGLGSSIKIDTLVLSGRGIQLKGLQESLEDSIKEQFGNSEPLTIQIKKENLKTIVSEGAIYYAGQLTSNHVTFNPLPITARYGILKRVTGGQYKYQELLNLESASIQEVNFNNTSFNGVVKQKELDSLTGVEELTVIKTYLQQATILKLLNDISSTSTREKSLEQFHQSSSHIIAFDGNRDFKSKKNTIVIAIDTEGEIYIKFNNNVKTAFVVPASDMENSEFFKKPMWYLF